jgi:hypothetical protein
MHNDRVPRDQEDLDREHETFSYISKKVFHTSEDDMNFLYRTFLLLKLRE